MGKQIHFNVIILSVFLIAEILDLFSHDKIEIKTICNVILQLQAWCETQHGYCHSSAWMPQMPRGLPAPHQQLVNVLVWMQGNSKHRLRLGNLTALLCSRADPALMMLLRKERLNVTNEVPKPSLPGMSSWDMGSTWKIPSSDLKPVVHSMVLRIKYFYCFEWLAHTELIYVVAYSCTWK